MTEPTPRPGCDRCSVLEIVDVRLGYPGRPDFLGPVSLSVEQGMLCGIVGPNGAGKSTLLRITAGLVRPDHGEVRYKGTPITRMSSREQARSIAYVPQHPPTDLDLSVRDAVLLGRYPHRTLGLFESAEDYAVTDGVMALTHTSAFADRSLATLSGGEAQRVHLAAALAQQPRLLLLDEPTASLDIQHQLAIFGILRDCARRDAVTVVVVLHDLNLAARFCGQILLLNEGRVAGKGASDEVLTPERLGAVYGVELLSLSGEAGGGPGTDVRWLVPRLSGRGA